MRPYAGPARTRTIAEHSGLIIGIGQWVPEAAGRQLSYLRRLSSDYLKIDKSFVDERDQLRRLGCDLGQGFYFHRPTPPSTLEALFEGRVDLRALEPATAPTE